MSMDKFYCDWCLLHDQKYREAVFVIITGCIDNMEMCDWQICMFHADQMCARGSSVTRIKTIAGIVIDEWKMNILNDHAKQYFREHKQMN
jgi:hypothetical protein